ncbi:MAG TPA: flagellar basal-body MS-ring/collar protein FliF [Syntrophorhabdaceae bacterium]|jgi:flagellar M-ring protein FliF
MEEYLNKAKTLLKEIPKAKLYTYVAILVGLIGALVIGLSFMGKEQYHTLFAGLSTEDASMIVTKLKEQKVPYKLGLGGNTISVPKEKVYDVRLMLASQNSLPGGGGVGFELFDKTNYGMTEFMQNINYKRAIQGELSRTINQMPEVKASRVHLAIPEKTLFTEKEKEVTASVFLKLKPGKVLAKDQVGGIVQLVSGSIENLKPENVSVIDSSGKILYKSGQADSPLVLSGQQYELQKNVEKRMEESIQSMLDKFIPASKSIVRANVELNLRKIEKMEEEYTPGKSAVTNERKSREKSTSQNPKPGGVPGVASNSPQTTATLPGQAPAGGSKQEAAMKTNESEREESQISYEVSKSVRKIVEPFGDIKKMSLAIVLDGKYERVKSGKTEEIKYTPRSQKELNDVKNLVARAVGYNEERGDKIEVQNIPFETDSFADEKAVMEKAERNEMIFNMGKYVFYIAILLSLFFFVVRPILNMLKKRGGEALPLNQIKDLYIKGGEKPEKGQKGQLQPPQTPALEDKPPNPALEAMKDKTLVGSIIKEWVREGI